MYMRVKKCGGGYFAVCLLVSSSESVSYVDKRMNVDQNWRNREVRERERERERYRGHEISTEIKHLNQK